MDSRMNARIMSIVIRNSLSPGMCKTHYDNHELMIFTSFTVAINELLCMKNAGAQIAMDFS